MYNDATSTTMFTLFLGTLARVTRVMNNVAASQTAVVAVNVNNGSNDENTLLKVVENLNKTYIVIGPTNFFLNCLLTELCLVRKIICLSL